MLENVDSGQDLTELGLEREKFWWNSRTHEVEKGTKSMSIERVGPFDTEEEARRAPQILAERAKHWEEEEEEL